MELMLYQTSVTYMLRNIFPIFIQLLYFSAPTAAGGLPPFQPHCQAGSERFLSDGAEEEESPVQRHQPLQQPRQVLGGAAFHLPLHFSQEQCSAWQLPQVRPKWVVSKSNFSKSVLQYLKFAGNADFTLFNRLQSICYFRGN